MSIIEAPQLVNQQFFSASRIIWHQSWHQLLAYFDVGDFFYRALVIHRVQSFLTIGLITVGAYMSLLTLTRGKDTSRSELWLAAMLSAVIWLLMHGTGSTAREGGPDSHFVQSWLVWYSVNYQISLPLYVASVGALLFALDSTSKNAFQRMGAVLFSIFCIGLGTTIHAAETAYFLFCIAFLTPLYLRGRQAWAAACVVLVATGFGLWAVIERSYVTPGLVQLLFSDDWNTVFQRAEEMGSKMIDSGLNRSSTGWHAIYTMSVLALGWAAILRWRQIHCSETDADHSWRPWIFLALSVTMPLALFFPMSSGLLALITYQDIAWRFAMASFLFLALPLLALLLVGRISRDKPLVRQFVLIAVVFVTAATTIIYSYKFEKDQASFQIARSLKNSLDRQHSYFGLDVSQKEKLNMLIASRQAQPAGELLCTDLFTAYYLFFVMGFHQVSLPPALEYVPGFQAGREACAFRAPTMPAQP